MTFSSLFWRGVFLMVLIPLGQAFSQDLIVLRSGETLSGQVKKVGGMGIRYVADNQEKKRSKRVSAMDVELIIYGSGMKQYFIAQEAIRPEIGPGSELAKADSLVAGDYELNEMYWVEKARLDANEYYRRNGPTTGTAIATAFYPGLGILTGAIIGGTIAAIPPTLQHRDLADGDLYLKNPVYAQAYQAAAHKIKVRNVLKGFGIGLAGQALWIVIIIATL